ncbi:MAG TPA: FAD-dependent oxidoreductase [Ohtaekwangia sp.]|nr:FAD-dependent oxidoreductase [Ohtaekwangia sp.]
MKRRKAIQQIGTGISAGILLPGWLAACKEDDPRPEVEYDGTIAIIGAGVAGLYLGDILLSKGIQVKIFEASSRAGGRIRNLRQFDQPDTALQFDQDYLPNNDFPTELGAERIFGSDSNWAAIINQLNVPSAVFSATSPDHYILDGNFISAEMALSDPDFIAARAFLETLPDYSGADVTVQQAIQAAGLSPRVYAILNGWIGNTFGTSNDRLGIKALAEGLNLLTRDGQQLVLKNNPMLDVVLSRFSNAVSKTVLNTVINSIAYGGERIILNGETNGAGGGSFTAEADKVIVTVPLSILKAGAISFNPPLPGPKVTALSRMAMDACMRIVLEFKKNFWGEGGALNSGFLYGGTASPEYFNAGIGRSQFTKTLNLTISGPQAEVFSAMEKDAVVAAVLAELDAVYDGQASLNVRRDLDDESKVVAVIMDWTKEPFIKGGVAYVLPGGTNEDRNRLATPVNDKIFFAGEATAVAGDFATVNGALASAERVAAEVVEAILNP